MPHVKSHIQNAKKIGPTPEKKFTPLRASYIFNNMPVEQLFIHFINVYTTKEVQNEPQLGTSPNNLTYVLVHLLRI